MEPWFKPVADHALLVCFSDTHSDASHAMVLALDKALAETSPAGMIETVPALVNLLVSFDVSLTDHDRVEALVRELLKDVTADKIAGQTRHVQVCYEAPYSPDLDKVAKALGLSPEAVITAHLAGQYDVLMYGFSPGYAYLSGIPEDIRIPRKPTPVRDVPAGSVIIAGPQCLVTTLTMPTGWSIIGRSPTRILTSESERPFLFDVGDQVTFERIDLATFERAQKEADND